MTLTARSRPTRIASRPKLNQWQRIALGTTCVALMLAIWEILARLSIIDIMFASSPTLISLRFAELLSGDELFPAIQSTAILFATGFGIALLLGLGFGVVIGWFPWVHALVNPWVSMLYAAPRIAFIPLIVVWVGADFKAQTVIIVINAMFPILVNTMAGVDAIDRQLLRVAQSFGASNVDVLRTVAIPGAIPVLMAGVRTGMMTALLGTVIAEYFVGLTGVGGMIFNAGLILDTTTAFVGAIIFAVAAMLLSSGLGWLQSRVDRWR
jgi:ABC-type nitrate/sulfonate/bicarbonate transport system, permease component